MKLFWSIIAIFALAAAGMAWMQVGAIDSSHEYAAVPSPALPPAMTGGDPIIARTPRGDALLEAPAGAVVDGVATGGAQRPLPDAKPQAAEDADQLARELVADLLDEPRGAAPIAGSPTGHEHQDAQQAENPWMKEPGFDERPAAAAGEPINHSIERKPDGSMHVDGLFTVKGEGTPEAPYEITWDLLMSAAETYQPRLGMNELPERIKMLDGRHVKIAGYLLFPMATFEGKEALVMLNMWDGCCIGVMPSPYDAVEVQLKESVPASTRQFINYGAIEGKLIVDPYLINDWLIGLYLLEDAKLNVGM